MVLTLSGSQLVEGHIIEDANYELDKNGKALFKGKTRRKKKTEDETTKGKRTGNESDEEVVDDDEYTPGANFLRRYQDERKLLQSLSYKTRKVTSYHSERGPFSIYEPSAGIH
jgi:hypothetical protein